MSRGSGKDLGCRYNFGSHPHEMVGMKLGWYHLWDKYIEKGQHVQELSLETLTFRDEKKAKGLVAWPCSTL